MMQDKVKILDIELLKQTVVNAIVEKAEEAISNRGIFTIALSGGSMPALLSCLADRSDINWNSWKILFADERCVPLDNDDSTFKAYNVLLFNKISIDPKNIIVIDHVDNPELAASSYEAKYEEVVSECNGKLDLVLLGIGPDGHVASLFPGHWLLSYDGDHSIMFIRDSPKPPSDRITMTLRTINSARDVIYVFTCQ
jgi:6-phosphogluconolactonase